MQSWLVSLAYATAEQLARTGRRARARRARSRRSWRGWRGRSCEPAERRGDPAAPGRLFLTIGAGLWAERPFMVGLIGLALLLLAMEGRLDPRWLLPIGWVWVNSHGSFPLGVVVLVVAALGQRLDGGSPARELACLRWIVPGMLLGAVGPLGPRVLLFPVELLQRQELLAQVIEWRAPTFDTTSQRVFIVQLVFAIVLVARRPSYRSALLVGVFSGAALLGRAQPHRRLARHAPGHGRSPDRRRFAVVDRPTACGPDRRRWRRSAVAVLLDGGPARSARPQPGSLPGRLAGVPGGDGHRHPRGPHGGRRLSSATSSTSCTGPSSERSTTIGSTCSPRTSPRPTWPWPRGAPRSGPSSTGSTSTS